MPSKKRWARSTDYRLSTQNGPMSIRTTLKTNQTYALRKEIVGIKSRLKFIRLQFTCSCKAFRISMQTQSIASQQAMNIYS